MPKLVDKPTTRIVGEQQRFDQREQHHTKAAMGGLGPKIQERFTSESLDPIRRILFPATRPRNVAIRAWMDMADGPINPERTEFKDPAKVAELIKGIAKFADAALVGICNLNPAFVYSHSGLRVNFHKGTAGQEINLPHKYAISLGVQMDYGRCRNSPSFIDNAEVGKGYLNAAKSAVLLAAYIRELGYSARAHFFINEQVIHVPIAVDAGLGELGRNGYLVTPEFGPRLRLSTVTTDLPMAVDKPVDLGVQAFCDICKKCAVNCPSQAIPHGGKTVVRGAEKWQLNADKCMTYWNANRQKWNDCQKCMATCPWNKPNVWYHRLALKLVASSRLGQRALLWLDDLMCGKRPNYRMDWLHYSTYDPERAGVKGLEKI